MAFVNLNGGHMWADEEFLPVLVALRLDTVQGVLDYSGEGYLRTHANRDNFHIVHSIDGRAFDLFLKRHRGFELKESIKFLAARSPLMTAGRREWENISRIEALRIPAMRPVAFGESTALGFELASFLITERIPSALPMDDFLREHFSAAPSPQALREKRALLWDLGGLVRRLHKAGLTHMDLYLNHVFVRSTPSGENVLHLIDLQRVARRWFLPRRWVVKDLAAIVYSAVGLPLSRADFARVFMAYFDGAVTPSGRRLVSAALRRARRMGKRRFS